MSDGDKVTIHEEVKPKDTKTVTTDDRGRAYLGGEYSDSKVRIAVLEVQEKDE